MDKVRLIDANVAAHGLMLRKWESGADAFMAYEVLQTAPTVDAEIVRHGRWTHIKDDYGHHYQGQCTECGCEPLRNFAHSPWAYCPNCGAKMGAKEDA